MRTDDLAVLDHNCAAGATGRCVFRYLRAQRGPGYQANAPQQVEVGNVLVHQRSTVQNPRAAQGGAVIIT
jgi:hypothetical protein